MCLRPQSAGSTIPRLRPTGSSLGIAPVDYDPVVLHKPFGPRLAAGALPSRASSMVAPGRPIRVPAFAVVPLFGPLGGLSSGACRAAKLGISAALGQRLFGRVGGLARLIRDRDGVARPLVGILRLGERRE